jgi:hypothetical protein
MDRDQMTAEGHPNPKRRLRLRGIAVILLGVITAIFANTSRRYDAYISSNPLQFIEFKTQPGWESKGVPLLTLFLGFLIVFQSPRRAATLLSCDDAKSIPRH